MVMWLLFPLFLYLYDFVSFLFRVFFLFFTLTTGNYNRATQSYLNQQTCTTIKVEWFQKIYKNSNKQKFLLLFVGICHLHVGRCYFPQFVFLCFWMFQWTNTWMQICRLIVCSLCFRFKVQLSSFYYSHTFF